MYQCTDWLDLKLSSLHVIDTRLVSVKNKSCKMNGIMMITSPTYQSVFMFNIQWGANKSFKAFASSATDPEFESQSVLVLGFDRRDLWFLREDRK